MAHRGVETHGRFFLPHLTSGQSVLDLGCGPGTITVGLAAAVLPGMVVGVDQGAEQLGQGRAQARALGLDNVRFEAGSCYEIPLADESVDRVFCHALFEHLAEPRLALAEVRRVLRPEGIVGICSPDWGGFVLSPASAELTAAARAYQELQRANGGDPQVGRKLVDLLEAAGFAELYADARYERYTSNAHIATYLADQLSAAGKHVHARTFHTWAATPSAMFAQAWVSVTGRRRRSASR